MFTSDVTYLHLAAQIIANQEIFYILKNLNVIDINAEDSCGETPLFYAVRCCNTPLIQNLFMIDDLDYKHQNKDQQDVLKVANKSQLTKQDELFANTKGDYLAKLISILGTNSKFN